MGAIAGGIASGRVPAGGVAGDRWDSWVNPTSVLGGVLAVVVGAFLAVPVAAVIARAASHLRSGGDEALVEPDPAPPPGTDPTAAA